jgi:hypothetical protein
MSNETMSRVRLRHNDLVNMLKVVDSIAKSEDNVLLEIIECGGNGIGSIVEVEIPVEINGERGVFRKAIVTEESW